MSNIFGILNLQDSQRAYVNDIGHRLVFDAINTVLDMHNTEVDQLLRIFVERDTVEHAYRYMLPMGGMAQPLGEYAPPADVKNYGYWDCEFPIRGWGDAKGWTRVAQGYLTVQQLDAVLDGLMQGNVWRIRQRLLIALFENDNLTWADPTQNGTNLTIRRLANTDGTLYPPVVGSITEAQDQHYRELDYTITNISAANNPIVTLRDEIIEHFGGRSSVGEEIIVFHNADATAKLEAIAGFVGIGDRYVNYGDDTDLSQMLAGIPGRIHGRLSGCWLSEWAWIPTTYMLAVHQDYPPLIRRVDPAFTGLGRGYHLVAENEDHPLTSAFYENRYGFGVGNRLSAAVAQITEHTNGEEYAPPDAYAE